MLTTPTTQRQIRAIASRKLDELQLLLTELEEACVKARKINVEKLRDANAMLREARTLLIVTTYVKKNREAAA